MIRLTTVLTRYALNASAPPPRYPPPSPLVALGPLVGGPVLYFVGGEGKLEGGGFEVRGYQALLVMSCVYFIVAAWVLRKVDAK